MTSFPYPFEKCLIGFSFHQLIRSLDKIMKDCDEDIAVMKMIWEEPPLPPSLPHCLDCSSLYCPSLSLYCSSLYCLSLYCPSLYCPSLYRTRYFD